LIHQFHLSPPGNGGICCEENGAFVGAVPMLARTRRNGKDEWRPRDGDSLSQEMSAQYGLPVDMSSKRGGLCAIAKALNAGDLVRAQIATVLLGVPDPPSLSKGAPSRQDVIKLAVELRWSGLLKADWDATNILAGPLARLIAKGDSSRREAATLRQANPRAILRKRIELAPHAPGLAFQPSRSVTILVLHLAVHRLHRAETEAMTAASGRLASRTAASTRLTATTLEARD
jgi:hypothetical protein